MKIREQAVPFLGLTGLSLSQDYNETIAMWNCYLRPPQVLYTPEYFLGRLSSLLSRF